MRLGSGMFDLGVAQDAVRDLDPKDLNQVRFDCMPFKKPIFFSISEGVISSIR